MLKSIPSDTSADNFQSRHHILDQDTESVNKIIDNTFDSMSKQNFAFNKEHSKHLYVHNDPNIIKISSLRTSLTMENIWNTIPHTIINSLKAFDSYRFTSYKTRNEKDLSKLQKLDKKVSPSLAKIYAHSSVVHSAISLLSDAGFANAEADFDYNAKNPGQGKKHQNIVRHTALLRQLYRTASQMTVHNQYYKDDYLNSNRKTLHLQNVINRNKRTKNQSHGHMSDLRCKLRNCKEDIDEFAERDYQTLKTEIHDNFQNAFSKPDDENILLGYAENPVLGNIYQVTAAKETIKHQKQPKSKLHKLMKGSKRIVGMQLVLQSGLHDNRKQNPSYYNENHQMSLDKSALAKYKTNSHRSQNKDNNYNQQRDYHNKVNKPLHSSNNSSNTLDDHRPDIS